MFSGEAQMHMVMNDWMIISVAVLLATGFIKIIITNVCIQTGWRGGDIFPLIFAGCCFGYTASNVFGVDAVFAIAVITASLCGVAIRKPLAVIVLFMLFFPPQGIIGMAASAYIGCVVPLPGEHKIK
jgi:H+/Cl- antiporter ClcA